MTDLRGACEILCGECAHWAIAPHAFERLAAVIAAGGHMAAREPRHNVGGATAVVPIVGPLVRRGGALAEMFGLTSYDSIRERVGQAVAAPGVDTILLYVDSPGGVVTGCDETADMIARAGRSKPVVTFVDGMMASAAFWLGAQASGGITAAKSSEVGSVGVYVAHTSVARAMDQAGIEVSLIASDISPFKVEGNAFEPLSTEARQHLQGEVNAIAAQFVRTLARGRGVSVEHVKQRFGRGRTMRAPEALQHKLIDRIGDVNEALRSQGTRHGRPAQAAGTLDPSAVRRRRLRLLQLG